MYVSIDRLRDGTETQTLGRLHIYDGLNKVFECVTLELKYFGNLQRISRIQSTKPGKPYRVRKRWSPKHRMHFHVLDVEGRSYILIHRGNYYTQIEGCILVGDKFMFINGDKEIDVANSSKTLEKMLDLLPIEFDLYIQDFDK